MGACRSIAGPPWSKRTGLRVVRILPKRGCASSCITPRAMTWGSSNTSLKLFTPAHGRLDQREQRVLVGLALGIGREARIARVGIEMKHLHEPGEQPIVGRSDREIAAVFGLEQLIGRVEAMAVAERMRHLRGL